MPSEAFFIRERNAAIAWARRVMGNNDWVLCDSETTGLDDNAEVVQLAVLGPDGNPLLDTLIKPTTSIPAGAYAVHGISDEMVKDAPPYDMVHRKLIQLLHDRQCIIYNASYDRRILAQTAALYGLDPPIYYQWDQCAMLQYSRFIGEWNNYRQSFKWPRLPAVEGEKAHSALADCKATLALIKRMAKSDLQPTDRLGTIQQPVVHWDGKK